MSFFYYKKPRPKEKVFKDKAKKIDYAKKLEKQTTGGEKLVNATARIKRNSKTTQLRVWMIVIPVLIAAILLVTAFLLYKDYSAGKIILDFFNFNQSSQSSEVSQIESDSDVQMDSDNLEQRLVAVVNNKNPIEEAYSPLLETYNGYLVSADMMSDLADMTSAAAKENVTLKIADAYVTAAEQQQRYEDTLAYYMNEKGYSSVKAQASTMRTVPDGKSSEHRTGLNITFADSEYDDFSKSPSFSWLYRNSAEYGFILRYPENTMSYTGMQPSNTEFRYVGINNAKRMRTLDMCLEEYARYLSQQ